MTAALRTQAANPPTTRARLASTRKTALIAGIF
jgi:hypothetical protein